MIESAVGHPPRSGGRPRRRPIRLHPQRDLDRGGHADPPARRCGRPRRRRRPGGRRRHLGCRRAAGRPDQFDAYYLAPQKCFAADGGLWLALLLAGRRRADRADRRLGPLGPGLLGPQDRTRQLRAGPDLQHPGAGHPLPAGRAARLDERAAAGSSGRPVAATARPRSSTRGPSSPASHGPSSRTRPTAAMSWAPSTSSTPSTPRRWPRCSGPTASSTPSPTASSAATSSASPCSRPSSPRTWPSLCACITHVVGALAD